ncbi:MAG TPA: class I SAM-dependent methyltransferase, partial [Bdellovibrionota bacterium]|nr:class I SAM-dependent methyltransferase [Bdellovibrionota bacterium]
KMHKHLGKWAKREGIEAYRVYDADLPDFSAAIDFYRDHLVIQEYQAPPEVPVAKAEQRLQEILLIAPEVLEIPRDQVILKVREKAKGGAKYQKAERPTGRFMVVSEYGLKFRVNLQDYIDTGLFLDHRALRHRMGQEAAGKDFLNLFGYTGAATVHAAAGGASSTTTVDLSSTYLDWAGENLALNGFSGDKHQLIQADCLAWLRDQQSPGARRYGLIFVDPPTFSNSKRMEDDLDLQRDHVELLRLTSTLLAPGGVLYFSTNARRFKLDEGALKPLGLEWREISKATLPKDFEGNPRIRRVWRASRP